MKKIIILLILVFFFSTVNAELKYINISPYLDLDLEKSGYKVSKKENIGLGLGYLEHKNGIEGIYDRSTTTEFFKNNTYNNPNIALSPLKQFDKENILLSEIYNLTANTKIISFVVKESNGNYFSYTQIYTKDFLEEFVINISSKDKEKVLEALSGFVKGLTKCEEKKGYRIYNGICTLNSDIEEKTCGINGKFKWLSNSECVCKEGFRIYKGECTKDSIVESKVCGINSYLYDTGTNCYCKAGAKLYNGACTLDSVIEKKVCGINGKFKLFSSSECECKDGYSMQSGICEAIPPLGDNQKIFVYIIVISNFFIFYILIVKMDLFKFKNIKYDKKGRDINGFNKND